MILAVLMGLAGCAGTDREPNALPSCGGLFVDCHYCPNVYPCCSINSSVCEDDEPVDIDESQDPPSWEELEKMNDEPEDIIEDEGQDSPIDSGD